MNFLRMGFIGALSWAFASLVGLCSASAAYRGHWDGVRMGSDGFFVEQMRELQARMIPFRGALSDADRERIQAQLGIFHRSGFIFEAQYRALCIALHYSSSVALMQDEIRFVLFNNLKNMALELQAPHLLAKSFDWFCVAKTCLEFNYASPADGKKAARKKIGPQPFEVSAPIWPYFSASYTIGFFNKIVDSLAILRVPEMTQLRLLIFETFIHAIYHARVTRDVSLLALLAQMVADHYRFLIIKSCKEGRIEMQVPADFPLKFSNNASKSLPELVNILDWMCREQFLQAEQFVHFQSLMKKYDARGQRAMLPHLLAEAFYIASNNFLTIERGHVDCFELFKKAIDLHLNNLKIFRYAKGEEWFAWVDEADHASERSFLGIGCAAAREFRAKEAEFYDMVAEHVSNGGGVTG